MIDALSISATGLRPRAGPPGTADRHSTHRTRTGQSSLVGESVDTNLRVLKPSRKAPRAGDVFAMQLPDGRFMFGRVVSTEAMAGPSMPGAILIYIYRACFDSMEPDRSEFLPDRLLVPPMMTNRLPWSKGYFETVAHWPLDEPGDVLAQHCFLSASRGRYFDEAGNELRGPVEPVGDYGLHSFRTIDDAVSDALGIDRVP